MLYRQLLVSESPELLEQVGPARSTEIILPGEGGKPNFLNGTVRNLSANYKLGVTFYIAGRESGTVTLMPLEKLEVKCQPCDRLRFSLEADATVTMALYDYTFQQVQAETEQDSVELLSRAQLEVTTHGVAVFETVEWVTETYNQSLNGDSEVSIGVLPRQDIVVKDLKIDVAGLSIGPLPDGIEAPEGIRERIANSRITAADALFMREHLGAEPIPDNAHILVTTLFETNGVPVAPAVSDWLQTGSQAFVNAVNAYLRERRNTTENMAFTVRLSPSGFATTAQATYIASVKITYLKTKTPAIAPL